MRELFFQPRDLASPLRHFWRSVSLAASGQAPNGKYGFRCSKCGASCNRMSAARRQEQCQGEAANAS